MVSQARARRIGDRIREELAVLMQREMSDPRLSMVTVTAADVDRELTYATIYVTAIGSDDRRDEVLHALEGASGFSHDSTRASAVTNLPPLLEA